MRLATVVAFGFAGALFARGAEAGARNKIFLLAVSPSIILLRVYARCESWTKCYSDSNCPASAPICQTYMLGNYCGQCSGNDCPSGSTCSYSGTCQATYSPPTPSPTPCYKTRHCTDPGYYLNSDCSSCYPCSAGTASQGVDNNYLSCPACPSGKFTTDAVSCFSTQ